MKKLFTLILGLGMVAGANAQDIALTKKNAYAYDINVNVTEGAKEAFLKANVSYRLNAIATDVKVQAYEANTENLLKEWQGTNNAGVNTVAVSYDDSMLGKTILFKVKVSSDIVTTPTVATIEGELDTDNKYSFYSPYGIVVNNNPASKTFGQVILTESMTKTPSTGYMSSWGASAEGIGIGLYAFDPLMQPIKNSNGKYGFTGGMTFVATTGANENVYDARRLAMSDDGRLFLSRSVVGYTSLWELDPENLETGAKEIFKGNLDTTTGYVTDEEGNFIAGPAVGMDVCGEGENLKVAILSCKGGYTLAESAHRVDVYNLGEATEWTTPPSMHLSSIDGLWINAQANNVCLDYDGKGVMVGQYRGTPSETQPSYKHVNLETGDVDFTDITTIARGAAMAWNVDRTLFAMVNAAKIVGIYSVSKDSNGVPTYTNLYSFNAGIGNQVNAVAFDYANNIYVVSNSSEKVIHYALPRENGDITVPAIGQEITATDIPTGVSEIDTDANAPVEYYNLQGVKVENPENGIFIRKQGSKTTKVVL